MNAQHCTLSTTIRATWAGREREATAKLPGQAGFVSTDFLLGAYAMYSECFTPLVRHQGLPAGQWPLSGLGD